MSRKNIYVAGAMTGTSGDGLDLCLLSFGPWGRGRWSYISSASFPYSRKLSEKVLSFQEEKELDKRDFLKFSREIAGHAGDKLETFLSGALKKQMRKDTAIAYHGQTVGHYPEIVKVGRRRSSLTFQAGEASLISRICGVTVVSDFRQADVTSGGEGAPLSPLFHGFLIGKKRVTSAFLNLGGISNVTVVRNGRVTVASDTGPGNMLIDGAVRVLSGGKRKMDKMGAMASKGKVSKRFLSFLCERDTFLRRPKPASTGREHYGIHILRDAMAYSGKAGLSGEDIVATLTEYTAHCVHEFLKKYSPSSVSKLYVAGGGAKNHFMTDALSRLLSPIEIHSSSSLGIGPEYVEAAAFAYLGFLCLTGKRVDTSAFTGGGKSILGNITPGDNFAPLMRTVHSKR